MKYKKAFLAVSVAVAGAGLATILFIGYAEKPKPAVQATASDTFACTPTPADKPRSVQTPKNTASTPTLLFELCVGKNGAVDHPQTYIIPSGSTVQLDISAAPGVPEETLTIEGYPDVRGEIDGGDNGEHTAVRFTADHPGTFRILNSTRNASLGFLTVR